MTGIGPGRFYVVKGRPPSSTRHFIFEPPLDNERDSMEALDYDVRTYPADDWEPAERQRFWNAYLDARVGTYEFRCRRYDAVIDRLLEMGMRRVDVIADIGAGRMEFAQRLRERDHYGLYVPIDGSIDGTDLNTWEPPDKVDWVVSIETIEHVHRPDILVSKMKVMGRFGLVVTTPNADAVDVLALDPTHLSPLTRADLAGYGLESEAMSLFTKDDDTLVGWFDRKDITRQRATTSAAVRVVGEDG